MKQLIEVHYMIQCAAAHLAAPIMLACGFRFGKASPDLSSVHMLIGRVRAHLRVEFFVWRVIDLFKVELQSAILNGAGRAFASFRAT